MTESPMIETTIGSTIGTAVGTTSPADQAVAIIDRALSEMLHRELVSTSEVSDLLLDLRSLLVAERVPVLVEG